MRSGIQKSLGSGSFFFALLTAVLLFSFCILPFAFAHHNSGAVSTATREGRIAVFDDAWQRVSERYYDPHFQGVDWEAQRAIFRPLAANARGSQEFYAVLRRMLALLKDAHTRVYAPEERFDWQHPRFVSIGISLREVEGRPTVIGVDRDSEAQRAGLRPGDIIRTIDGRPASSVFDSRLREQIGSSTPQASRLRAVASLAEGPPETNVEIGWKGPSDKDNTASLKRRWHQRSFTLQISQRPGHVLVVIFDAFTPGIARDFGRALRADLSHARGIVIDLRNNGGGDAEAMAEIASAFLPATRLGRFTDRFGSTVLTLDTSARSFLALDQSTPSRIPIFILTSERTSSAAEIFAAALKDAHRGTIIGTETCGCVLAIRTRHNLPDGGELDVSELDYRTANDERLEGRGIAPDETVVVRRRDLYSRHDRALELAMRKIAIGNP